MYVHAVNNNVTLIVLNTSPHKSSFYNSLGKGDSKCPVTWIILSVYAFSDRTNRFSFLCCL